MTKNKLYTQLIVFSALMLIGTMAKAQVKVGKNPTSINANAVFEMEDTTKGMLLPRLALSSSSAFTPLTAHVRGMVVYNTATALDVTPGFYYNDGVKWVRIAGSPSSTGSGNLTSTSGGALIVTGGTGATLINASIAVDKDSIVTSTQVSKVINSVPARDSIISTVNNQITTGNVTGQNLTSTSGGALIVTGGSGTSLKSTSIAVNKDSIVTSTQVSKVINSVPTRDSIISTVNNQIISGNVTGQNLTAGSLLQTTGTPTGASLKAAGYQVDTTALKTFIGRVAPLTADSTTASNGLTMTGKDVRLGGALTAATTITTTGANTLALAGLQSGATTDSILVVNPTTNVVSRISAGRFKNGNLVVTTAASLTVADIVDVVIFRGTAASTITLPAAASNIGKVVRILNYAASATNVDITLSPAPVIQGGTTNFTNPTVSSQLTSYGSNAASALGNSIEVVSDGTNWYKLGN